MKKIAIGVLVFVAVAVAAVLLFRSGDERQIEKLLERCAEAARNGDAEEIIRHLDPSCTLGEQSYAALCERLRSEVRQAKGMMIDLQSAVSVGGEEAFVTLHVKVHALQHVLAEANVSLKLKKSGGEWRFVRVDEAR